MKIVEATIEELRAELKCIRTEFKLEIHYVRNFIRDLQRRVDDLETDHSSGSENEDNNALEPEPDQGNAINHTKPTLYNARIIFRTNISAN